MWREEADSVEGTRQRTQRRVQDRRGRGREEGDTSGDRDAEEGAIGARAAAAKSKSNMTWPAKERCGRCSRARDHLVWRGRGHIMHIFEPIPPDHPDCQRRIT